MSTPTQVKPGASPEEFVEAWGVDGALEFAGALLAQYGDNKVIHGILDAVEEVQRLANGLVEEDWRRKPDVVTYVEDVWGLAVPTFHVRAVENDERFTHTLCGKRMSFVSRNIVIPRAMAEKVGHPCPACHE